MRSLVERTLTSKSVRRMSGLPRAPTADVKPTLRLRELGAAHPPVLPRRMRSRDFSAFRQLPVSARDGPWQATAQQMRGRKRGACVYPGFTRTSVCLAAVVSCREDIVAGTRRTSPGANLEGACQPVRRFPIVF